MTWRDFLQEVYNDPNHPTAFAGPSNIFTWLKKEGYNPPLEKVKQLLQNQDEYSLLREIRKNKRFCVRASGIGYMADADLIDMMTYAKENEGYAYILLVINVFSKYLWREPLKTKTDREVIEAFDRMFCTLPKFSHIHTDWGKEFTGRGTKKIFQGCRTRPLHGGFQTSR